MNAAGTFETTEVVLASNGDACSRDAACPTISAPPIAPGASASPPTIELDLEAKGSDSGDLDDELAERGRFLEAA